MRSRLALLLAFLALAATACNAQPEYDAEPIGGDEQCFNIERESEWSDEDETNLGTFCQQGGDTDGD